MQFKKSVYNKIILFFIFFVIIPVSIITTQLIVYITRKNRASAVYDSSQIALQETAIVNKKIQEIKNMFHSISSYNTLTVFLDSVYYPSVDFQNYNTNVVSFVKGAIETNYSMSFRIYMMNRTIPQGYGIFYSFDELDQYKVIHDFLNSGKLMEITLPSAYLNGTENNNFLTEDNNIIFIYKIQNIKRQLAVAVLKIPEKLFYIDNQKYNLVSYDNRRILNYSSLSNENIKELNITGQTGTTDGTAYTVCSLPEFPFQIMVAGNIPKSALYYFIYEIIIIAVVSGDCFFVLYYFHELTARMYNCLSRMKDSIHSGFTKKLPVEGEDEIAGISENINILIDEIKHLMEKTVEQETVGKQTYIYALQNQINPHFIYNTLEIFSSQMELYGHYAESEAMSNFSRMLRYNLTGTENFATVREEIDHMKNYMNIQLIRFPMIKCNIDIQEDLYACSIIRFVFQPILENCISHGLDRNKPVMTISVHAEHTGNDTLFVISDDGTGMSRNRTAYINRMLTSEPELKGNYTPEKNKKKSIGLYNINKRLKLFYGEKYHITVQSKELQGTVVLFRIPYQK
jgi:two-component system, sensor histidine kinase YesM